MEPRASVAKIKREIAARFPEEANVVDARMEYFDDDANDTWIENFCDTMNEAMARRNELLVQAHLSFLSQQLAETASLFPAQIHILVPVRLMPRSWPVLFPFSDRFLARL